MGAGWKIASALAFLGTSLPMIMIGQAQAETIVVGSYGGAWGAAIKECVATPFAKATGVDVDLEPNVSTVTLGKLRQQKDDPVFTVTWLDGGVSELAEDVLGNIDPAKIDGFDKIAPQAVYRRKDGSIYAISTGYFSLGIAYNPKFTKQAPTSWKDLWLPAYAKKVLLPSVNTSVGVPFIANLATLYGGGPANVTPAIDQLKNLDVSSYYDASGMAANSFLTEESVIGAFYNTTTWDLIDKGVPVAFAVPKEGALANDIRIHIVKGNKNPALADKFVNMAVSKTAEECFAQKLYLGPSRNDVSVDDRVAGRLPWGKGGSLANLAMIDWTTVNANRETIVSDFNRSIGPKK